MTVSLDITPSEVVRERIDERDHFAAVASLRPLLAPSSIAVVGAAETPGNVGRAVLSNIVAGGFQGAVMPVNRAAGVVCLRRAVRRIAELETAPELVIITAAGDEVLSLPPKRPRMERERCLCCPPMSKTTAGHRWSGRSGYWRSSGARACGSSGRVLWEWSTPRLR